MSDLPQLVVAGNYEQYLTYLRANNLTAREAIYVESWGRVAGVDASMVVRFGTWWDSQALKDDPFLLVRLSARVKGRVSDE